MGTQSERLEHLANDEQPIVRWVAASSPATPPEVLARVVDDSDEGVVLAALGNPSTPGDLLADVAVGRGSAEPDVVVDVVVDVVENRAGGHDVHTTLGDGTTWIGSFAWTTTARSHRTAQATALANPNCPVEVVLGASESADQWQRLAAAGNPAGPEEMLDRLSRDGDLLVRLEVAGNPSTPAHILARLAQTPCTYEMELELAIVQACAENPALDRSTQELLAGHSEFLVRERLPSNPAVEPDLLARLASDVDEEVRRAVGFCPRTPAVALRIIAADESYDIGGKPTRLGVLMNPRTPSTVVRDLLCDPDFVQSVLPEAVDTHRPAPDSLLEVLRTLDCDPQHGVMLADALDPGSPEERLRELHAHGCASEDWDYSILLALLNNLSTPDAVFTSGNLSRTARGLLEGRPTRRLRAAVAAVVDASLDDAAWAERVDAFRAVLAEDG